MTTKYTSIAQLVQQDYDGNENPDDGLSVREVLNRWRENDASAKVMIEARGQARAIAEYRAAWDTMHRAEYDLGEDDEA